MKHRRRHTEVVISQQSTHLFTSKKIEAMLADVPTDFYADYQPTTKTGAIGKKDAKAILDSWNDQE